MGARRIIADGGGVVVLSADTRKATGNNCHKIRECYFLRRRDASPTPTRVGPSFEHQEDTKRPPKVLRTRRGGEPYWGGDDWAETARRGHQVGPKPESDPNQITFLQSNASPYRTLPHPSLSLPTAKTTTSCSELRTMKHLNLRPKLEPCQKWKRPVTSSQEIGWGLK